MIPVDLGVVDNAVLITMSRNQVDAQSPHMSSPEICQLVARDSGIDVVHSWEALVTLSRSWELQHPLIDFYGNNGSPGDPPADARYTKVRLTKVGAYVADSIARGETTPVALITGDACRGGIRPPIRSETIIAALESRLHNRPGLDAVLESEFRSLHFPTGARIVCDSTALVRGESQMAEIHARLEPRSDATIMISGFPPGVGVSTACEVIRRAATDRYTGLIRGVSDESDSGGDCVVVRLASLDTQMEIAEWLSHQWPLRIRQQLSFGVEFADLIEAWVAHFPDGVDPQARLSEFRKALESGETPPTPLSN